MYGFSIGCCTVWCLEFKVAALTACKLDGLRTWKPDMWILV